MMSKPPRAPIVISRDILDQAEEPPFRWRPFFETSWQVWTLGICVDWSVDWKWIGLKFGPWCVGVERRREP